MNVSGTGHRPNKLGGYDTRTYKRLVDLATATLKLIKPTRVISGMALGWDQALAEAAINLGIPVTAAIPFEGQASQWPKSSQAKYASLLKQCDSSEVVCEGGYAASKMQVRNEWMVDRSDLVLALWDGSHGGTGNCIEYASSVNKPIRNLWASWVKYAHAVA